MPDSRVKAGKIKNKLGTSYSNKNYETAHAK